MRLVQYLNYTYPRQKIKYVAADSSLTKLTQNQHYGTTDLSSSVEEFSIPGPSSSQRSPASQKRWGVSKPEPVALKGKGVESSNLGRDDINIDFSDREISTHPGGWNTNSYTQKPEHILTAFTSRDTPRGRIISPQETYIHKVCCALMVYGAPTHRLEAYMHKTAEAPELNLESFYLPGCMIISINDSSRHSRDAQIVRCAQSFNLSKLYDVHAVYKDVIHAAICVEDAIVRLDESWLFKVSPCTYFGALWPCFRNILCHSYFIRWSGFRLHQLGKRPQVLLLGHLSSILGVDSSWFYYHK